MPVANTTVNTGILNAALVRLGEKTVIQFTDHGPATVLYEQLRLAFLERFQWGFATYRQALVKFTEVPASDFSAMYAMPTEPRPIKEIDIELSTPNAAYRVESLYTATSGTAVRVLLTNADSVVLNYVGDTDESLWSPLAIVAMSKWLAAELSTAITGKANLRQILVQEAEAATQRAIVSEQTRDTPKRMEIDGRYEIARRSSAGYDPDRSGGVPVTIDDLII